ncbi:MAG: HEAT repeat domain-containing protein [Myxococcales bacterium]|nr:HEAT repeat domain-containing protein [Myxococcales bacterium]MBK7198145.1 HEAT repeat domain-containing protein [Myxococcales bacterium]MBP6845677.1 HEAT repeat domain-containing protein [Kofleriaceae bacterium]
MRPALLLSLVVIAATACGPSASVQHANTLLARGDYRGASDYTAAELSKHPGDAELHRIRLRALLGLGDPGRAVADYRAWRAQHGGTDDRKALRTMALTTVWQGVTSPSAALRLTAIRAIERLELEELAEDVGKAMGDDDDAVAAAAAVAVLRSFGQAPDVAQQMLRSDDPRARAIAVEGIGRKVRRLAIDDLRPLAGDPDPQVRAAVARYLGTVGGDGAAELVTMTGDGAAEVRAAAIAALAAGGGGRAALPDATRFLADESLAVRLAAVALVAKAGGKPALEALLAHADPMVAATAAHRRGDRAAAVAVFDRALGATDVGTRAGVVNLLAAALPQDAAIARATAALADPAPTVKLAAARALAYLGQHGAALTALTALAATAAPADRADAAAELARLGDPHGAAILTELAGSPDADVRRAVVQAHVGAGAITAGLWGALADDQAATRLDAAIAILTLAG